MLVFKPLKINKQPIKSVFYVILFFFTLSQKNLADDASDYKKNVAEIGKKIQAISANLNANKALLKTQQDELLEVEQDINQLNKSLAQNKVKIDAQKAQDIELLSRIEELESEQDRDKKALSNLLVSRYINGQANYIKLLLNQENPYAVGRLNNYYEYFAIARNEKLAKLRVKIIEVQTLQEEHKNILAQLQTDQKTQILSQQKLDFVKQKREASVATLSSKVSSAAEQLKLLEEDRSRLNALLKQIADQAEALRKLEEQRIAEEKKRAEQAERDAITTTPAKPVVRQVVKGGFIKQQGRLGYPVDGKIKYNFGSRLPESGMRSEGAFFDTSGSVPVKSIFRGQVLFADFLKGYGLLLIIDHGDDHISLYGHNDLLYKKVGDSVETNELVANTGVTGGLKSHGLYFEIRKNATPVDPKKWWQ